MKCPNCGNDLIAGAQFCASCGNKIPEELFAEDDILMGTEPDRKKKRTTRIIGVATVAIVVAAVGFGGFKVWNMLHPKLDKQLLYAKDGRLYFTADVSKEEEPVEIFNAHDDDLTYDIKYAKNKKYVFFRTSSSDDRKLYRVNTQKLTSNESKNEKYIEEIDSNVIDFSVLGGGKALYYRYANNDYGKELNYYDGKDTEEIDSDVKLQRHKGDMVYYLRYGKDDDNEELCYYNLKSGKHGDMDECREIVDYTADEILYAVSDGDTYDIYKAKPGNKATKVISEVKNCVGDLNDGEIWYAKVRSKEKSYYDFVNDPYVSEDADAIEPNWSDYMEDVYPEDIMDSYAYEEFCNDKDAFWSDYVDPEWDEEGDLVDCYVYFGGNTYHYSWQSDSFYSYDEQAYSDACVAYNAANQRNELRDELKSQTYDCASYDIYLYTAKGGEKKIAESVQMIAGDLSNKIFLYDKVEDLGDKKVCSIDDLEYASDVENYIEDGLNDSSVYAYVNGKEQDLKMTYANMSVSEDGKTVMIVDRSNGRELIAYKKKGDSLEKIGMVEKNFEIGSWQENDYYYYDEDWNLYVYANGKSKKIAKDVNGVELENDGNYLIAESSSSGKTDIKVLNGDEQIAKLRDVDYGLTYVDKNCIVYGTSDGDLNVYNGEDSRRIDRNVFRFWMPQNGSKQIPNY